MRLKSRPPAWHSRLSPSPSQPYLQLYFLVLVSLRRVPPELSPPSQVHALPHLSPTCPSLNAPLKLLLPKGWASLLSKPLRPPELLRGPCSFFLSAAVAEMHVFSPITVPCFQSTGIVCDFGEA